ncbi:hypothetical protein [Saccharothrix luteola]|uniref:hypothetical protein n=1 Tax=Saccharothrix luteola TaxID=2893018 RepID=UPI001E4E4D01|nr:hypothetical protein [Saccharothrix luteola]MCC8251539.1 hypothetical protein [Saccharothrix luteola]
MDSAVRGVSVALMGIDGAGKTTLLNHLGRALDELGFECVDTSRKAAIRSARSDGGFPARSLERLWLESWRSLLGGGHADGSPVDSAIPLEFTDRTEVASGWIVDRLPASIAGVRRSGPLASASTELTMDQIIRAEVVEPVLARGAVTLADGFGFSTATKNIRIAREIPADATSDDALDQFETFFRTAYSMPLLQPDIGFLLDVEPRRSYEWRMRQDGRLGAGEDLWLAGRRGADAYMALQTAVAAKLRAAAVDWGWNVLQIDGRPQRETAAHAVEVLTKDTAVQRLIEHRVDVK